MKKHVTLASAARLLIGAFVAIPGPGMQPTKRSSRRAATDYDVAIERTLKGNVKPGERPTVSVLGGRVRFPDGSWRRLTPPA